MRELDELHRECLRYVAEHYVTWTREDDNGYEGSDSDSEAVWCRAIDATIGSRELWDGHNEAELPTVPDDEVIERAGHAFIEIWETALTEIARESDEQRLFGKDAVTRARACSREWSAVHALGLTIKDIDRDGRPWRPLDTYNTLWFYLVNVRDGIMDATYALDQITGEDDEDESLEAIEAEMRRLLDEEGD